MNSQSSILNSELLSDILESLDLSRAEPGTGYLEALFARFNARVLFENASKIVRDADVGDPDSKPRRPDIFWAEHIERGTGGTCFARVAALDALLKTLGYSSRTLLGRVERDDDHAALLVQSPSGPVIVDVGFPLPAIVPARSGAVETPLGGLRIEETVRGFAVSFTGGVPEGPRSLEIFSAPVAEEEYLARWRQTFRPRGRFLREVVLRRDLGGRLVSFLRGTLRVDDLHSRLSIPVLGPRPAALAELFGIDQDLLSRAFRIAGDPDPDNRDATLTAYLEVETAPVDAFAAIATREGYGRLLQGVAGKIDVEDSPTGFRFTLSPSGEAASEDTLVEDVSPDPEASRIEIVRRTGRSSFGSSYRAESRQGRTYLIRVAALPGDRTDLLRNDSLRGRLAGTLAVDLLAWARMLP